MVEEVKWNTCLGVDYNDLPDRLLKFSTLLYL